MPAITSVISNFMWRRNAERLETEEPDEENVSDNNSITEEGEEGEFVGVSNSFTPILESLPEDEEVTAVANTDEDEESIHGRGNVNDNTSASAPGTEPTTTTPATLTSSRELISVSRIRGFTLRDLEEEREIVQRRTGACVLFSSFLLLRLWIQAVMTSDFGLLLLCLVFTSWTARFVRYTREREEELNRMINDWDENAEEEESTSANDPRLRRMSFQSQLALAVMQSQIQMMEGGYGHPDGGESRSGVGDDAKSHWDRFEYKTMASLMQRGHYGSVALDKDGVNKSDVTKNIEEKPQCSICLCEYDEGDKIVSLPCKHFFHDDCITSWTNNNTRCPLCNSDLESLVSGDEVV